MDDLISVIVPVYKVEKYLRRCVDSILHQTYQNLEIILIDDGSPDNCGKICDQYAAADSRVSVIHKANGGQSSARNAGLSHAKGKYIAFIDSDDCISEKMIMCLYRAICDCHASIAACQYVSVEDDQSYQEIRFSEPNGRNSIWNEEEALIHVASSRLQVWNKLYDASIVKGMRFAEGILFEDIDFCGKCFEKMNSLVYVDAMLYGYTVGRDGSTVSSYGPMRVAGLTQMSNFAIEVKEKGYSSALPGICALFEGLYVSNYYDACRLKADETIKHRIVAEFKKTYALTKYKRRMYIELFHISPKLTYEIWKIVQLRKRFMIR